MNNPFVYSPVWLLVGCAAAFIIYISERRARITESLFFGQGSKGALTLWLLAVCALTFAALRPHAGRTQQTISLNAGEDIIIAIDVSISMLAQDVQPSRLSFAVRKATDIVRAVSVRGDSRIGLVLYAGDAYVYCPLTSDYPVLEEFLRNVRLDNITARGSSIARALEVSRRALAKAGSAGRVIVIGDGEELAAHEEVLNQIFSGNSHPLLFLATGTEEGAPIPLPQGGFLAHRGNVVQTKSPHTLLREALSANSKQFALATLFDTDFMGFLAQGDSKHSGERERTIVHYQEYGSWVIAAVVVLIGVAVLRRPTILLAFLVCCSVPLRAHASPTDLLRSPERVAVEEYQRGDFLGAAQTLEQALERSPNNPVLLHNLASAYYRLNRFEEAEKSFKLSSEYAKDKTSVFSALYGAGNAALADARYKNAIEYYTKALSAKAEEPRALHNRSIAEAKLKEQEQQNKKSSESSSSSSSQGSESSSSQSEASQSSDSSSSSSNSNESSAEESRDSQSEKSQASAQSSLSSEAQTSESAGSSSEEQASSAPQTEATAQNSSSGSQPLSELEAERWLESLAETPIIMKRLQGDSKPNTQGFW